MKQYTPILLSLFCCFNHAIDLSAALDLAKKHDPGYQSQVLNLKSLCLNGKIAAGDLAPRIDLALFGSDVEYSDSTTSLAGGLKLSINADLYNSKTTANYKKGKFETQESIIKLQLLDISHSVQTSNHYFDALKSYSNFKVKQFALNQYEQSYREAVEKEKAGLLSPADTLVYLSNLDLAKLALTIAKNDLDHKLSTLEGQINTPIQSLSVFNEKDIPLFEIPSLSELNQKALSSGYPIQLAHIKLKKSRNDLLAAETAFMPKATLSLEKAQPLNTLYDHFFESGYSSQKISLALSINAFAGFKDLNILKQKRIAYQSAESCLDEEQYSIKLAVEKAYRDHENNRLQAHTAQIALKSANASLQSLKERRNTGKASELEYTTAITQATLAQESFYDAVYTLMAGYLTLKSTASVLDSQDIAKVNQYLNTEIVLHQFSDPS